MDLHTALGDGYLRMTLEGRTSLDASVDALRPGIEACRQAGVMAVLVDVRALEGEATVTDRYYVGSAIASVIGSTLRIALLCREDQFMADRPLENTAVNRGAQFLSTTSEDEAIAWLQRAPR